MSFLETFMLFRDNFHVVTLNSEAISWKLLCCLVKPSHYFVKLSHYFMTIFTLKRSWHFHALTWILSRYHVKVSRYCYNGPCYFSPSVTAMHFFISPHWLCFFITFGNKHQYIYVHRKRANWELENWGLNIWTNYDNLPLRPTRGEHASFSLCNQQLMNTYSHLPWLLLFLAPSRMWRLRTREVGGNKAMKLKGQTSLWSGKTME